MSNADQESYWRGQSTWVAHQRAMDACLAPVLDLVLDHADLQPGHRVLDIGCGTGASVLAAAQKVGPTGHVLGLDIADTLLDLAAQRCADLDTVTLLNADAQTATLPMRCDVAISRFGVMFFEDSVAAFSNIAASLQPGARITCAAWAAARDNPFFVTAAAAARQVFPPMPKTDRTQPGPFAFEDAARVSDMLTRAGLDLSITTKDILLRPDGDLNDFAALSMAIGPAASAIRFFDADPDQIDDLRKALCEAFRPYFDGASLSIPASIHILSAKCAP